MRRVVAALNLNGDDRVAAVTYSTAAAVRFHLGDVTGGRYAVLDALTFYYAGGTTDTAAAIRMLNDDVFRSERGDR